MNLETGLIKFFQKENRKQYDHVRYLGMKEEILKRNHNWCIANPDKLNKYYQRWYSKHRNVALLKDKESRFKNKEKFKARSIFRNLVAKGKIVGLPCEICGGRGEGHHPDYSQPLNIQWLCHKHHSLLHFDKLFEEQS